MVEWTSAINKESLTGGFVSGTTRDTGISITGGHNDGIQLTQQLTEHQKTIGLNSFTTQNLIHENLTSLGSSSVDISNALKDQIQIREDQRLADNESALLAFDYTLGRFADVDAKLGALGGAVTDVSNEETKQSFFSGFPSLPTFDDIKTPLIIAGLGLAALMIVPRLIKSGFK
jgi:hypothetical protein